VRPCIKYLLLSFALLAVNNTPGACGAKKSDANANRAAVEKSDANRAGVEKPDANSAGAGRAAMIQSGTWGGKGILVQVTDDGATVEYDCAHGTIERLEFKGDGFEARGTHTFESFGPTRAGDESARPARYTGRVSGDEMTLTVTLTDTLQEVGTFSLARGRRVRIVKCK
jgi:hypothetical protein